MSTLVSWPGQNGRLHYFTNQLLGHVLPSQGGVYIASKMTLDGRFQPFYVGQAQNLHKRVNVDFASHDGLQCSKRRGATYLSYLIVGDEAQRLALETELRRSLRPPCNKQGTSAAARLLVG